MCSVHCSALGVQGFTSMAGLELWQWLVQCPGGGPFWLWAGCLWCCCWRHAAVSRWLLFAASFSLAVVAALGILVGGSQQGERGCHFFATAAAGEDLWPLVAQAASRWWQTEDWSLLECKVLVGGRLRDGCSCSVPLVPPALLLMELGFLTPPHCQVLGPSPHCWVLGWRLPSFFLRFR